MSRLSRASSTISRYVGKILFHFLLPFMTFLNFAFQEPVLACRVHCSKNRLLLYNNALQIYAFI